MSQEPDNITSALENADEISCSQSYVSGKYLYRLETELDPLPILSWLSHQSGRTQIYWGCRSGDLEIAAAGCTDSMDSTNSPSFEQALSMIQSNLQAISSPVRYYGGRCFDPEKIDAPEWDGFGSYRFVLPEYELIRQGDAFTIVWNVLSESESDVLRLKHRFRDFIRRSISSEDKTKDRLSHRNRENAFLREDTPSEKEWIALSQQLIESMKAGEVEKVVLAHKVDLTFEKPLDPIRLLESVRSQSVQTYSFLFRFPGSGVFLGGSPERLFKKDGCTIFSEAIAGTRPVAKDRDKNIKLQKELLQSAKELQEHAYVTDDIEAALKSICEDIHSNQSSEIVAAASVQHLLTPFQGTLKKQTTLHEIISAIHPTAAVNGVPAQKATEQIRSREPFCRGWYAGPVGWVMADEAEFAAAIRSALVQDQRIISIYGGAGLVKDSVPEQEWEETEHKIRLILDAAKKNIG